MLQMRYNRKRNWATTLKNEDGPWRGAAEGTAHVSEDVFICKMIERVSMAKASLRVGTWRIHSSEYPASTDPGGHPASRRLLCIWVLDKEVADTRPGKQVAGMGGIGFQFAA